MEEVPVLDVDLEFGPDSLRRQLSNLTQRLHAATWRLPCSSYLLMTCFVMRGYNRLPETCFLIRDQNILPKKESPGMAQHSKKFSNGRAAIEHHAPHSHPAPRRLHASPCGRMVYTWALKGSPYRNFRVDDIPRSLKQAIISQM